ncbi:MAG: glycosyltransferase family 2 protein [Planctomycetota bacterium]|jgi:GT2 family glycosyltransferase
MKISAVISTWNKREAVLANVAALKAGRRPPDEIVVVDNASADGTAAALRAEHPDVVLVEMPHDRKGACETFNIGFETATGDAIAIMDDDVEATEGWLETLEATLAAEPPTTAMVSSRVIEPGMPEAYQRAEVERGRYYASTFRGCGTLARAEVLRETGGYDERFFIYGNERDLAARVLQRGLRVLQVPEAVIHHATPFGMKAGRRSLYYHVRNFWLYAFKNCAWGDVLRVAFRLAGKGVSGGGTRTHEVATGAAEEGELEATGTMGLASAMRETPGAWWIVVKATLNALLNLPYCLGRRAVVRSPDFRLPGA